MSENRCMYQRSAEGLTCQRHVNNPSYSHKQFFHTITFVFNNEQLQVKLPEDVYDLGYIEEVDCNGLFRIKITRDCRQKIPSNVYVFKNTNIHYFLILITRQLGQVCMGYNNGLIQSCVEGLA